MSDSDLRAALDSLQATINNMDPSGPDASGTGSVERGTAGLPDARDASRSPESHQPGRPGGGSILPDDYLGGSYYCRDCGRLTNLIPDGFDLAADVCGDCLKEYVDE